MNQLEQIEVAIAGRCSGQQQPEQRLRRLRAENGDSDLEKIAQRWRKLTRPQQQCSQILCVVSNAVVLIRREEVLFDVAM
jgi:hypothetical protein